MTSYPTFFLKFKKNKNCLLFFICLQIFFSRFLVSIFLQTLLVNLMLSVKKPKYEVILIKYLPTSYLNFHISYCNLFSPVQWTQCYI